MHFELILPGLNWPTGPGPHPASRSGLPALGTLLGFASHRWDEQCTLEALLTRRFGMHGPIPHARLRRLGEMDGTDAPGHWLCCDPVHLHFARDKLLLADASGLAITRVEADTLMAGLNETFGDIGQFEAPAPDRWYLRVAEAPVPRFHPIADVNGRPVQLFLPEGDDCPRWARLSNEIEVWLYNHPINEAREANGQRRINGIWLWGAGETDLRTRPPVQRILANAPYPRGLARHAGIASGTAEHFQPSPETTLAVVDTLHRPLLHMTPDAWTAALETLEKDWFAPLLQALKAGQLKHLRITVPGDRHLLELEIGQRGLWKFWRKPQGLDALLATAPSLDSPS
ncbi:hypothetical protein [Zoogloea sp.]|uniref:hypothetical protein n=1 Tax=Zoogloea sp. TaxID=49181 RepID=UPI00262638F4|nr:hypothetical protein [Zoogloea sp.]MDD3352865.1 hypothetical protein [Zoogloea sp.]